jgi:hypothetical protein
VPFAAGNLEALDEFVAAQFLSAFIALSDLKLGALDLFVGGEAVATVDADPATTDGVAIADFPAIDYTVFFSFTFWTSHAEPSFPADGEKIAYDGKSEQQKTPRTCGTFLP